MLKIAYIMGLLSLATAVGPVSFANAYTEIKPEAGHQAPQVVTQVQNQMPQSADPLESWFNFIVPLAYKTLLAGIHPPGTHAGIVIASPDPRYFYHWVRDAALVMDVVIQMYIHETDPQRKQELDGLIKDYIAVSRQLQMTRNPSGGPGDSGDGEAKFNVDATPFWGDWVHTQHDSEALRAIGLTDYALQKIKEGNGDFVRHQLWDGKIPTQTLLKGDVESAAHHWSDVSGDLWEEVRAKGHFYTNYVQRRALLNGAMLARAMDDEGAAGYYEAQANLIKGELEKHKNPAKRYILATLGEQPNNKGKVSNLDIAVILAVIHAAPDLDDGFMTVTDDWVMATAWRLREANRTLYPINQVTADHDGMPMEPAIGRYPEDTYDGYVVDSKGNPWLLATAAMGEYYYRLHNALQAQGFLQVTDLNIESLQGMVPGLDIKVGDKINASDSRFNQVIVGMKEAGNRFMRRIRYHSGPDGELPEQFYLENGYATGVKPLEWDCAAILTAEAQRTSLMDVILRLHSYLNSAK